MTLALPHDSSRDQASILSRLATANSSFWEFGAPVENFQVVVIREEPMPLFPGRLLNHAELHHVLQSLRHSGRRERKLFGCRRDRDDRLALKVQVNAQNRSSRAAKLLN